MPVMPHFKNKAFKKNYSAGFRIRLFGCISLIIDLQIMNQEEYWEEEEGQLKITT